MLMSLWQCLMRLGIEVGRLGERRRHPECLLRVRSGRRRRLRNRNRSLGFPMDSEIYFIRCVILCLFLEGCNNLSSENGVLFFNFILVVGILESERHARLVQLGKSCAISWPTMRCAQTFSKIHGLLDMGEKPIWHQLLLSKLNKNKRKLKKNKGKTKKTKKQQQLQKTHLRPFPLLLKQTHLLIVVVLNTSTIIALILRPLPPLSRRQRAATLLLPRRPRTSSIASPDLNRRLRPIPLSIRCIHSTSLRPGPAISLLILCRFIPSPHPLRTSFRRFRYRPEEVRRLFVSCPSSRPSPDATRHATRSRRGQRRQLPRLL